MAPFAWLGLRGVVGQDFACNGIALMFHIVLDLGGMACEVLPVLPCLFPNSPVELPI